MQKQRQSEHEAIRTLTADGAELAQRFAPLVRVWSIDPPGDPDVWLADCDLLRYDQDGANTKLCAGNSFESWPSDARSVGVRPYETSPQGLAFVPRARAPKFVPKGFDTPSFSRRPFQNGAVVAPCFYDIESLGDGFLLSYWLFFPTSASPGSLMGEMLPAVLDAMNASDVSTTDFPPLVDEPKRTAIDRFWERVYSSSGFGRDLVRGARNAGMVDIFGLAAGYQLFGVDGSRLLEQLDPVERERVASLYVHEGDWEGISVELDRAGSLRKFMYWAHGKPVIDNQPVTQRVDASDRFVVEVGIGSHACGRPGTLQPGGDNLAGRLLPEVFSGSTGTEWRTWSHIRPAASAPWYAFGGAWGRPRLPPVGLLVRHRVQSMDLWIESTGPLGPGPEKLTRNGVALEFLNR